MSKTMVILTGPQGANLQLFANLLSVNAEVYGVDKDGKDRFSKYWEKPALLKEFDWNQSNYYVTFVSCPYFVDGKETLPKFQKFYYGLHDLDVEPRVVLVGSDPASLVAAQKNEGVDTMRTYFKELKRLMEFYPLFVSPDMLQLNSHHYLEFLQNYLKVPVTTNGRQVKRLIKSIA